MPRMFDVIILGILALGISARQAHASAIPIGEPNNWVAANPIQQQHQQFQQIVQQFQQQQTLQQQRQLQQHQQQQLQQFLKQFQQQQQVKPAAKDKVQQTLNDNGVVSMRGFKIVIRHQPRPTNNIKFAKEGFGQSEIIPQKTGETGGSAGLQVAPDSNFSNPAVGFELPTQRLEPDQYSPKTQFGPTNDIGGDSNPTPLPELALHPPPLLSVPTNYPYYNNYKVFLPPPPSPPTILPPPPLPAFPDYNTAYSQPSYQGYYLEEDPQPLLFDREPLSIIYPEGGQ
ncbi:hypothetical protein LPJ66_004029 [Kickxella alabastrina]|uniref:Uncharacterized protein n=1 Tax=Kickxella alabastrina TaxID=61397 RepID=A0ACC1INW3_9FUNG|nr:hypothetical protein LPJ66_004029 [Kickxella alabastrina]